MNEEAIKAVLPTLEASFAQSTQRVFSYRDLVRMRSQHAKAWKLPSRQKADAFLSLLTERTPFRKITLASESEDQQALDRYVWGDASPYLLALSIKSGAYLTHGSAVFLHGLNDQLPKTIYVNKEQSAKSPPDGPLTQQALDLTFSRAQRRSRQIYSIGDYRIVLLHGKNTERLEVGTVTGTDGERLDVTTVARTLIDIAVRPNYAGGVFQVLAAYEQARDRVSVNALLAVLKKLDYKYPYHQAVGFYLTRADYPPQHVKRLKGLGLDFDFYLDYAMAENNRDYDSEWRLFYPKGF